VLRLMARVEPFRATPSNVAKDLLAVRGQACPDGLGGRRAPTLTFAVWYANASGSNLATPSKQSASEATICLDASVLRYLVWSSRLSKPTVSSKWLSLTVWGRSSKDKVDAFKQMMKEAMTFSTSCSS
jgi:hypothetical protein